MTVSKKDVEKVDEKTLNLLKTQLDPLEGPHFLAHAAKMFSPGRLVLISSFGTEAAILLHMLSRGAASLPVVFLDTGKLFEETRSYREQLEKLFNLKTIHILKPEEHHIHKEDAKGHLWEQDSQRCCHIRKVLPMQKYYKEHNVLGMITGRKRFQTEERADAQKVEMTQQKGQPPRFRLNPLAFWEMKDIENYQKQFKIPPHPLFKEGYRSIGCVPCSAPSKGYRDGRWKGRDNKECGIHV